MYNNILLKYVNATNISILHFFQIRNMLFFKTNFQNGLTC